ncbi:hypothetical protein B9Z55_014443 [Caenorhabditis nigoni]|uniref:Uncharacterized protein n=1 Tax=Caenorhabditis nigoni TaxID=1611254 RepID=A0A2G5U644_9PELO|nr:hypothetical protein B9Z55_014443 [Caenorhabditis nigoni]
MRFCAISFGFLIIKKVLSAELKIHPYKMKKLKEEFHFFRKKSGKLAIFGIFSSGKGPYRILQPLINFLRLIRTILNLHKIR